MDLEIDGEVYENLKIRVVAIANGQYFGGGMKIAPFASLSDGLFDIVVLGNIEKLEMLFNHKDIYKGSHVKKGKLFPLKEKELLQPAMKRSWLKRMGSS